MFGVNNGKLTTTIITTDVTHMTRRLDFAKIPRNITNKPIIPDRDPVSARAYRQAEARRTAATRLFHVSPAMRYRKGRTKQMINASPLGLTTSLGAPDKRSSASAPANI